MNTLNDDQLAAMRVHCAELCGWTFWDCERGGKRFVLPPGVRDSAFAMFESSLPDYPRDLNAMHEAEELIFDERFSVLHSSNSADHAPMRYLAELRKACGAQMRKEIVLTDSGIKLEHSVFSSSSDWLLFARATAEQRCLAFIRVFEPSYTP